MSVDFYVDEIMCIEITDYFVPPSTLICKTEVSGSDIVRWHFKGIAYLVGLHLNAYKVYFPEGKIVDYKTIDEKTVEIELTYEYKKPPHKCLTAAFTTQPI